MFHHLFGINLGFLVSSRSDDTRKGLHLNDLGPECDALLVERIEGIFRV